MKLIKIAEPDNFIVVEGNDFHNNNLAPKDFAYHWKLKEIVQVHFKIVESGLWVCTDGDKRVSITLDGYKLLKITHSSQPLTNILPLDLKEVRALIQEALNKKIEDKFWEMNGIDYENNEVTQLEKSAFDTGYKQCLEDNKEKYIAQDKEQWELEIIEGQLKIKK